MKPTNKWSSQNLSLELLKRLEELRKKNVSRDLAPPDVVDEGPVPLL